MQRLAEIPLPEVERVARSGRGLVILPVGVVEEHGAHLPLGLDSFAAEVYAEAAAPHLEEKGYEIVIAPTISYGVARAAIDFPGTLSLEPETLRSLVVDIGGSLSPGRAPAVGGLSPHPAPCHSTTPSHRPRPPLAP